MKKLSNGMDSTLGNYLELCMIFFGNGSKQVDFINNKINEATSGKTEEVIADESQMLILLGGMGQRSLP